MFILLPSMKPVSFSPWTKAGSNSGIASEEVLLRKPITFRGSCARAGDNHAAAPPRRVMNSRRLMGFPDAEGLHPTTSLKKAVLCITQNLVARVGSGSWLCENEI